MIDLELKKKIGIELIEFFEVYWNDLFVYNLYDKKVDEWNEDNESFVKKEIIKPYLFSNPQYDEISEEVMNDIALINLMKSCFEIKQTSHIKIMFMKSFIKNTKE